MLSNRTGQWTVGAALLCVIVLAASWFMLITPRRAHATDVRGQARTATDQAQQAQAETARLKAQYADLPKEKAQLAAIKAQLPPKANVATLVSDLQVQAAAAGVSLNSIVPGTPTVEGPAGASTSLAAAGSVVSIPLTVTATGDYFEDALFTKYLQTKLTRTFLLNTVSTTSAATTSTTTATPTATGTAAPTPAATASTSASTSVELTMNGSVFVLLDGTSTLGAVAKDAQKATTGSSS